MHLLKNICIDTPKFDFFQFEHIRQLDVFHEYVHCKNGNFVIQHLFRRHKNVNLFKAIAAIIQPTVHLFTVNIEITKYPFAVEN